VNLSTPKSKLTALLGTTSLLTTLGALAAQAGEQTAQQQMPFMAPEEIPENVLVTGSLIHGTVAVGVPVTNLGPMDFATTGAPKIADLFKNYPQANVYQAGSGTNSGGHLERETRVNLRGLDQTGPRSLMMIDGMRFPPQADGICSIDPSIIPAISLDHIDILADGASATYGSDAISGVINVILRRNYDGAMTQVGYSRSTSGKVHYLLSQLWGRTWDGGQITLSYEWYDDGEVAGTKHSNYTMDYRPWGLDDQRPVSSSSPGTVSKGSANAKLGTGCTNCFAVPLGTGANFPEGTVGPTAPFSASTLTWSALSDPANSGTNGARNVFDPLLIGQEDAPQQRNAAVMTVDQRLTKDISFYGSAFYSNRRNKITLAANVTPDKTSVLSSVAVPTFNPYYPTGGAPTNLRVSYNLGVERPPYAIAYELSLRYQMGLNIALPAGWSGQLWYSESSDANLFFAPGNANLAAVSAALGWTIDPVGPTGTAPSFGTWTKPAAVPYLNLFCDPHMFQCNSSTTLNYIGASRTYDEKMWENEKGVKADGPLFDLPGGTVKAAIGATYTSTQFAFTTKDNSGGPNLTMPILVDAEPYQVWAAFAQLNIPIFGEENAIPFFRRLDLEASWRHDQYTGTLSGGTSNPKLGFTWLLSQDAGLSLKGSWGTSFRFANAGEYSTVASTAIGAFNLPDALAPGNGPMTITCLGGAPRPGSTAATEVAAGFKCGDQPGGLSLGGGPTHLLRPPGVRTPFNLAPESATNWSGGFDLAPTAFLPGLDVQATYYVVKINGLLQAFNIINDGSFAAPAERFHFITPSDLASADPACATADATPTLCAPFEDMVRGILLHTRNAAASPVVQTSIYWINDGGTVNAGARKLDGVDFSASYDWDMGNIGAFNTGVSATYYLHDLIISPDGSSNDIYRTTLAAIGNVGQEGVATLPRMHYRGRLGWSKGSWNVTGFVDYQSHYYHTQSGPPNVNGNFCTSTAFAAPAGGTFPCAISNYTNLEPPWYSFDLSIGYDTGEDPANDYLKHVAINFVVQDIMDKHSDFQYGPSTRGRAPAGYDLLRPNNGRTLNLLLTKTW
jgi:iron complex outermembrane receptor protein